MTSREKNVIRHRDRDMYGGIPEGMQMHHLWYSEEYDPNSFIIVTPEEHAEIHGKQTGKPSTGFTIRKWYEEHREEHCEKSRQYYYDHKEEQSERMKNWRAEHKEEQKEYFRKYREEHKEELKEKKHQQYLRRKHRQKLIDRGVI